MLSFSDSIDKVILDAINQFKDASADDVPRSMTIMIKPPAIDPRLIIPPLLLEIAMAKVEGITYAILLGWYAWNVPQDSLGSVLSQLLSLQEMLDEDDEDDEDEDSESSSKQ